MVAPRLPSPDWPERSVLITAVDARTGEPVVFDRDSGVDLVDAGGSRVETIFPDSRAEHLFGASAMDLSLRAPAAQAGHEQGRAQAEHLTDLCR